MKEIIDTKIKVFRFPRTPVDRYQYLTFCQKHALIEAYKKDCAFVYLTPDNLYADGTFAYLIKIAAMGKRVIMQPNLEVTAETFIPAVIKRLFCNKENSHVFIPNRVLVKMALNHLHPVTKAFLGNPTEFTRWPSSCHRHFFQHKIRIHASELS